MNIAHLSSHRLCSDVPDVGYQQNMKIGAPLQERCAADANAAFMQCRGSSIFATSIFGDRITICLIAMLKNKTGTINTENVN